MVSKGQPEKDGKGRRLHALHVIVAAIEAFLHLPLSLALHILQGLAKWGSMLFDRVPRNCDSREELYQTGARMLRAAKRDVKTVSTIENEEPSESSAIKAIRQYFIELFRIAYRNRFEPSNAVEMVRYSNLKDPEKCHEALALLCNGAGVAIRHSELPMEFVITDRKRALIGFPSDDTTLFGGFRSHDTVKCAALTRWVESQFSNKEAALTPQDLVDQIEAVRVRNGLPEHGRDCLCRVAQTLPQNLSDAAGKMFDATSDWIDGLYDETDVRSFYRSLAEQIRNVRHGESLLTFLDVGCGTALGVNELKRFGFSYWGVDISERMIQRATEHLAPNPPGEATKGRRQRTFHAVHGDAIAALLSVGSASKQLAGLPKKVDVVACQGNAFDSFIGPAQKRLALCLFIERLHPKGFLVFTGARFSPDITKEEREPVVLLQKRRTYYEKEYYGEYCWITVSSEDGVLPRTAGLMHPTDEQWLNSVLRSFGYERVSWQVNGVTPRGGPTYYVWVYQRTRAA